MALANFRSVYGKNGSGRFVVSEGIAPSEYLLPHEGLPTLYSDLEDNRFEIVITQGTILSVVPSDDFGKGARIVPANGSGSAETYTDGIDATPATVTVPANSVPIGCAQYDLYRPFDKGTSQGAGWITTGYVEWPVIDGLNEEVEAGDLIVSDNLGRPVVATGSEAGHLIVGKVIAVENFATNFDDGLLSYMQMPSDPGALREVYSLTQTGDYQGRLGIRVNLDRANVVGAMRVVLTLT